MTDSTFDQQLAFGHRERVGGAGVDSGTMCIATSFPDDVEWDGPCDGPGWAGPTWGCTASGWGDGHYDILRLDDNDGHPRGIEVLFCSPTIEAVAERKLADDGIVEPTVEQKRAVHAKTADEATSRAYRQWSDASDAAYNAAWAHHSTTIDPGSDADPVVFGHLDVPDGRLGVGDPSYVQSRWFNVTPGRYALIAWQLPNNGYTARIGAYLTPDQR